MQRQIQIIIIILLFPILNFGQDFKLDYKPKKIRKEIRKIARKIGIGEEIHSKSVGFGGERTSRYDRFELLAKKATMEELVELMGHPKPAVRGYAFWGLAKKHYKNLEDIFVKHANDEEYVLLVEGCMASEIRVIDFMRFVVMPQMLDTECKKLDDSAFDRVSAKRVILQKMKKEGSSEQRLQRQ